MSDYLINLNFDKIEQDYGTNEYTIEYHDGTFIPKYLTYKKFWIEPKYGAQELRISEYEFKSDNIEISDGKYNGIISNANAVALAKMNIDDHKFYINRIVYNNFESFSNNFTRFKENILMYYNSICFIYDKHLYTKDEDMSLLIEFRDGCDKIFKYLSNYQYNQEFAEDILELVEELKEKIPQVNVIIYNSLIVVYHVLKDAELSLITDVFGSGRGLKTVAIQKIHVNTIDIVISGGIHCFEIHHSNVEKIIFGARTNCKNYYFDSNSIDFIKIRSGAFDNVMQFVNNKINIIEHIPYYNKYLFHNNKFSNTAYKKLYDLHKEIESNLSSDWKGLPTLVTPDSKEYESYYETLNTCWTAGFDGGNDESVKYNRHNFIIIDAGDKFFISNDLNMADLMSKYKLNDSDWYATLNLIKLLAK
jgi:hypothetical protein